MSLKRRGVAFVNLYGIQRSGMAKLPNKFVPECHEHVDCARLSVAKEWTQDACEWTRWLYRKNPWQFGRGAVPPPRTAIPLLYDVFGAAFFPPALPLILGIVWLFVSFVLDITKITFDGFVEFIISHYDIQIDNFSVT